MIFSETYPKIDINDIRELETRLNFKLDDKYTAHLLKYNGGSCEPSIFKFIENEVETESSIRAFFAVKSGDEDDIEENFEVYKSESKRMPDSIFPIAYDSFGNLVCINSTSGKVYFWNHEKEVDYSIESDEVRTNLHFIAEDFEKFLEGLYDEPVCV